MRVNVPLTNPHRLPCVPHPVSVSAGPSSAARASGFPVQTQPPHPHSAAAAQHNTGRAQKIKREDVHADD